MSPKKQSRVSRSILAKARQVLKFAEECAGTAADCTELRNALFGPKGKASELFATEPERAAFLRTNEHKRILALLDKLPHPPVKDLGEIPGTADGAISLRLPRSVHAALSAEAKAQGISLNQLCLSKLTAQLRAVV
jgi:hypothetical protein